MGLLNLRLDDHRANAASRPAKLVCFDLGGVVVRICRTFEQACAQAGIEYRSPDVFASPDLHAARRAEALAYQLGQRRCDDFFEAIAGHTAGLYVPDEIRAIHDAWLIEEYAGMADVIAELARLPAIATACLSNTNHLHWLALTGSESSTRMPDRPPIHRAVELLDYRLASHTLGLAKPDPAIYRALECETGFTGPEIIFFDDLRENIEAARLAGWHAVQIDHAGDPATQVRDSLGLPASTGEPIL